MKEDTLINFLSCDFVISTLVTKDMGWADLSIVSKIQVQISEVYCENFGEYKIFHLFIKKKYNSKFNLQNFETAIETLKRALEE